MSVVITIRTCRLHDILCKEEGGEECRRKESELEHSLDGGIMNIGDIRDNTRVKSSVVKFKT